MALAQPWPEMCASPNTDEGREVDGGAMDKYIILEYSLIFFFLFFFQSSSVPFCLSVDGDHVCAAGS